MNTRSGEKPADLPGSIAALVTPRIWEPPGWSLARSGAGAILAGRAALGWRAWGPARYWFEQALEQELTAEAFEGLALAAARLGEASLAIEARRRAYDYYCWRDDQRTAARLAAQLAADIFAIQGDAQQASEWFAVAHRQLARLALVPEHGWLALTEARFALTAHQDQARAARLAARARIIGQRVGLASLVEKAASLERRLQTPLPPTNPGPVHTPPPPTELAPASAPLPPTELAPTSTPSARSVTAQESGTIRRPSLLLATHRRGADSEAPPERTSAGALSAPLSEPMFSDEHTLDLSTGRRAAGADLRRIRVNSEAHLPIVDAGPTPASAGPGPAPPAMISDRLTRRTTLPLARLPAAPAPPLAPATTARALFTGDRLLMIGQILLVFALLLIAIAVAGSGRERLLVASPTPVIAPATQR